MKDQEHEDVINNPSHYTEGFSQEIIVTIVEWIKKYSDPVMGYLLGTHLKYIPRANIKHKAKGFQGLYEDLKKADFYWREFMEYVKSLAEGYEYIPKELGGTIEED